MLLQEKVIMKGEKKEETENLHGTDSFNWLI